MDTGLKGRVAIVAGSSAGIGRATALAFAAEGAHLALCARRQAELDQVAADARSRFGVETHTAAFDVADPSAVRSFVESAHARFGRVDVCVPNAGGPPAKPFLDTTLEDWERAWHLNLRSAIVFSQAVLPHMQQAHWGRIVTLTSYTVKQPVPELVLSNTIRAGIMGLVRSLAGQFGKDGITINNVGPGCDLHQPLEKSAGNAGEEPECSSGAGDERTGEGDSDRTPGDAGRGCRDHRLAGVGIGSQHHRADYSGGWREL